MEYVNCHKLIVINGKIKLKFDPSCQNSWYYLIFWVFAICTEYFHNLKIIKYAQWIIHNFSLSSYVHEVRFSFKVNDKTNFRETNANQTYR